MSKNLINKLSNLFKIIGSTKLVFLIFTVVFSFLISSYTKQTTRVSAAGEDLTISTNMVLNPGKSLNSVRLNQRKAIYIS